MHATQAVMALSALGQETRLALFRLLVERGPDGLPAGVIAERLGIPPSSLTFHLQHLHRAGLVTQRRLHRRRRRSNGPSNQSAQPVDPACAGHPEDGRRMHTGDRSRAVS